MAKYCEFCKQAIPDNLSSCPNCDIADLFGSADPTQPMIAEPSHNPHVLEDLFGETVPAPAAPQNAAESDIDLGGDPLAMFDPMSSAQVAPRPGTPRPPTKAHGPLPPIVPPPSGSPLLTRAAEAPPPESSKDTGNPIPKMTHLATHSSAPVTMLAPSGGAVPTMLAPASAAPTQLADEGPADLPPADALPNALSEIPLPRGAARSGPSLLAQTPSLDETQAYVPEEPSKKTMLARGGQPTMLAKNASPTTQLAPPDENAPLDLPPDDPAFAKKTMLAKQAQHTVLAPSETQPLDYPPGEKPKATMLAKQAQHTVLAPSETEPLDYPPGQKPKATMLAKQAQHTVLAPSETEPLDFPPGQKPKATMLAKTQNPTVLVPSEHNTPLDLPPGHDIAAEVEFGPDGRPLTPSLSGEMARAALEGGTATGLARAAVIAEQSEQGLGIQAPLIHRPQVKPWYAPRWFGGMIVGAGLVVGLWFLGLDIPEGWRKAAGLNFLAAKLETNWEEAKKHLKLGRFQDHLNANADPANVEQHAAHGEAVWLQYLTSHGGKANANDPEVAAAIEELTDPAKTNADAAYHLAQIDEFLGKNDKAKEAYTKGAKQFPKDKRRFETALERLEQRTAGEKKADDKKAGAFLTPRDLDRAETLVLLLAALQAADDKGPGEKTADADEAGYLFWDAAKAARNGDFKDAAEKIKKARELHAKFRFVRLRQQQNPGSDPNEEIFLQAAKDLETLYGIRAELAKAGTEIADNKNPAEAVKALVAKQAKPDDRLKELLATLNKDLNLGLKEADVNETNVAKGVKERADDLKLVDDLKAGLEKGKYVTEKQTDPKVGLEAALKDAAIKVAVTEKIVKASGDKDADLEKATDLLIADRDSLKGYLGDIAKKLVEAKFLNDPKVKPEELLAGVDLLVDAAQSPLVSSLARTFAYSNSAPSDIGAGLIARLNVTERLATTEARLAQAQITLMQVRKPDEMVGFWLPLLEDRSRKDALEPAALDAKRVLDDKTSGPEVKALAQAVDGLVLRNQGKFDDARTALGDALKGPKADWQPQVAKDLRALSDPADFYLPHGEALLNEGRTEHALAVFTEGAGAFPKDGRLLALRGLASLEGARRAQGAGKLLAKDPAVAEAAKDAEAAIGLGAKGDGTYLQGRIAEETGDAVNAVKLFRKALELNPVADRVGSRYRVSLGRALLGLNPLPSAPGAPVLQPVKPKLAPPQPVKDARLPVGDAERVSVLALLLTAAVADDDDDNNQELDEIIKLADEAIAAGNAEGYLIKAGALARKGQWTEGLKVYNEGLKRLIKPEYAEGLGKLIDNHPSFNLPDPLRIPDPTRADKHYSAGLRMYFAGRYAEAEKELGEARRNQSEDARIEYFLGLSQMAQPGKKKQSGEAFLRAYNLEQQSKPGPQAVNASLERVQGEVRQYLNKFRGQ